MRFKNHAILIGAAILLALLIGFIIMPGITGYSVYQDIQESDVSMDTYTKGIKGLQDDLLVADTKLTSCDEFKDTLLVQLEDYPDQIATCAGDLAAAQVLIDAAKQDAEKATKGYEDIIGDLRGQIGGTKDLQAQIDSAENQLDDLEDNYDTFASNFARSKCCKMRVDNPNINFYEIKNNNIVCLTSGTKKVSC